MNEDTEVTVPTTAQVRLHLAEGVQINFCGHSFKHIARVLMGDASPKEVAFIVFGHIDPPLADGSTGCVIDCEGLEPIFEFGHELSGI